MGQKINPIGLRLGINRGWDSTWFAKKKDFGKYLIEDFKIRNYIKKNITNSGVSEIIIERSSKKCTVAASIIYIKNICFQFYLQKSVRKSFRDSVYQFVGILNENFSRN